VSGDELPGGSILGIAMNDGRLPSVERREPMEWLFDNQTGVLYGTSSNAGYVSPKAVGWP
jgi:hypothetical protein